MDAILLVRKAMVFKSHRDAPFTSTWFEVVVCSCAALSNLQCPRRRRASEIINHHQTTRRKSKQLDKSHMELARDALFFG